MMELCIFLYTKPHKPQKQLIILENVLVSVFKVGLNFYNITFSSCMIYCTEVPLISRLSDLAIVVFKLSPFVFNHALIDKNMQRDKMVILF